MDYAREAYKKAADLEEQVGNILLQIKNISNQLPKINCQNVSVQQIINASTQLELSDGIVPNTCLVLILNCKGTTVDKGSATVSIVSGDQVLSSRDVDYANTSISIALCINVVNFNDQEFKLKIDLNDTSKTLYFDDYFILSF